MKAGVLRLQKEYKALLKEPAENIAARPSDADIFKWHYVICGPKGSPYEGGVYHGLLQFPQSYPYKPPRITMRTPNGRFAVDTRLCLSMSDFHPESWNPLWKVSTILSGLLSFMLEEEITSGSISTSPDLKRRFARDSLAFNLADPTFRKLFPQYLELAQEPRSRASAPPAKTVKSESPEEKALLTNKNPRASKLAAAHAEQQPQTLQPAQHLKSGGLIPSDRNVDRLIIFVMIVLLGLLFKQLY